MTDTTSRYALPYIQPGQAQKEVAHNEALARIDCALHPVLQAIAAETPPDSPAPGAAWAIGANPSGAWAGHAGALATWTDGGWRFIAPAAGMIGWLATPGRLVWHDGNAWRDQPLPTHGILVDGVQVVGQRGPSIAAPAGGATVDSEARGAVNSILAALKSHGLIAP